MPILLVILLIFGSCATPNTKPPELSSSEVTEEIIHQLEGTFRLTMQRQERIELLALPIMRANAALCGKKTRSLFGFDYLDSANTWEMEPAYRLLYLRHYGIEKLHGQPIVTSLAAGSPAAHSDLQPGDRIMKIGGDSIQTTVFKRNDAARTRTGSGPRSYINSDQEYQEFRSNLDKLLKRHAPSGPTIFTVQRKVAVNKDTTIDIPITAEPICSPPVYHSEGQEINAYTDGENIVLTAGMLDFATDNELALVITHELAHCIEGHISKKKTNALLGGIMGAVFEGALGAVTGMPTYGGITQSATEAGATAFSQAFEQEADYVGLYLMARAGFDTEGAADFWRLMAARNPVASNNFSGTHPPTAHRYLLLDKTHAEIERKKAESSPLVPNRQE